MIGQQTRENIRPKLTFGNIAVMFFVSMLINLTVFMSTVGGSLGNLGQLRFFLGPVSVLLTVLVLWWSFGKPSPIKTTFWGLFFAVFSVPFMIVMVFTLPVWILTGICSLIYAFLTGMFKKPNNNTEQNNISVPVGSEAVIPTPVPKKTFWKRWYVKTTLIFVFIIICFWIPMYGFNLNPCEYRETNVAVGENLRSVTLVSSTTDLVYFKGYKGGFGINCTDSEQQVGKILTTMGQIKEYNYFLGNVDNSLIAIKPGTKFIIEKAIIITKVGITTIDSGPGGYTVYILKDENGVSSVIDEFTFQKLFP